MNSFDFIIWAIIALFVIGGPLLCFRPAREVPKPKTGPLAEAQANFAKNSHQYTDNSSLPL
jgi:hypothetical protein